MLIPFGQNSRPCLGAELRPETEKDGSLKQGVLDETVAKITGERYWLKKFGGMKIYDVLLKTLGSRKLTVLDACFLRDFRSGYDVADTLFLSVSSPWIQTALERLGMEY